MQTQMECFTYGKGQQVECDEGNLPARKKEDGVGLMQDKQF